VEDTAQRQQGEPFVLPPWDAVHAADVLLRAFMDDPAWVALIPDPAVRSRVLRAMALARARDSCRYAAAYGVRLDDALASVALWMPPAATLRALPAAATMIGGVVGRGPILHTIAHACRAAWRDRASTARLVRARRQALRSTTGRPTWYLALFGTDPRFRRRGAARRLLAHVLDRCDADGVPAWLETTDADNVAMYERFGFGVIASAVAGRHLPGYWAMWRAPAATG
jgi:ribosomal protein S18 acetylase RimI-like enzyme